MGNQVTNPSNTVGLKQAPRKGYRKGISTRGQFLETVKYDMAHDDTVPSQTFGVVDVMTNPIHRNRVEVEVEQLKSGTSFPQLTETEHSLDGYICKKVTTEDIVADGTAPEALSLNVIESKVSDLDNVHSKKTTTTVTEYSSQTDKFYILELGAYFTETRELIAAGTAYPTITPGQEVEDKQIDCKRTLRTTRELLDYGDIDADIPKLTRFNFPAYLVPGSEFVTNDFFLTSNRRSVFQIYANRRDGFTQVVRARLNVTFHDTPPDEDASVVRFYSRRLHYPGILFAVNEPDVLVDPGGVQANTHSRDSYYGFGVEQFNWGGSVPTATEYIAMLGTEQLVADEVTPWKFNLWRRERLYVTML